MESKTEDYEKAKKLVVGALTYDIRQDWNNICDRQDAIEKLFGYSHEDAYEDGRYYRDEWDGPYDAINDDEDFELVKSYPDLYHYLGLLECPDSSCPFYLEEEKENFYYITDYQIKDKDVYNNRVNFIVSKKGFNEEDIKQKMQNHIEVTEKEMILSKVKEIEGIILNISVDASKYVKNHNNCCCMNEYSYKFVNIEFVDNNCNLDRIDKYLNTLDEFYIFDKAEKKIKDLAGFIKSL